MVYRATQELHSTNTNGRDIGSGISEAGLFVHSEGNLDVAPDLQLFFYAIPWLPLGYSQVDWGFTGVASLTHPQNSGSVTLRTLDPSNTPIIRLKYLQSQSDVQKLVAGIQLFRRLFHSSSFDELRGEEVAPGTKVQSGEALVAYVREVCNTMYHPVGTCKMGTDPMAVVDPEFRVHGVEGLRIVDASIMPTITTGNTNAPTIMIGEKAADLIKAVD
nr:GMC oxidoreductase [Chroococcidiopsis sp. CCMEE 29]